MRKLRVLLTWPFSLLWFSITKIRNFFYDRAILKSTSFSIPLICVGNLAMGGTGKTPMINHLVEIYMAQGKKLAILSRGYGRNSKGFRIAGEHDSANTIGDEPLLFYKRWKDKAVVAVGEKRVPAVHELTCRFPGLDLILMDDGFQHRAVTPSASILLTTFKSPFYRDYVVPAGNLRESRLEARRAAMIVVTKCPGNISAEQKGRAKENIRRYTDPAAKVFFSHIRYGSPVLFGAKNVEWSSSVILVTGIADATDLTEYLKTLKVTVLSHIENPDHHRYGMADFEEIQNKYEKSQESVIVTTEKDFVKMKVSEFEPFLTAMPFFYIPLEFSFSKEKENFEASLLKLTMLNQGHTI